MPSREPQPPLFGKKETACPRRRICPLRRARPPPCGGASIPYWLKVSKDVLASPSRRCRRREFRQLRSLTEDGQTCSRNTSPSKACAPRLLRGESPCCSRFTSSWERGS